MLPDKGTNEFDIIIIGGGITGAGTARDCSLRGLRVLLVERFDFATGATGRNHGLLHSGARYAVTDKESAAECIQENMILRKIARHCIEESNGLFVSLLEDDLSYQSLFVKSCQAVGINAQTIDPAEAREMEPAVNPSIIGAVKVPDGAIDPFKLTLANIIDAKAHGATVLTYHEVTALLQEQGCVIGITTFSYKTKANHTYYAPLTINAGGIWGHNIAAKAGIKIDMLPSKGSLLVFEHRINNIVLNRCRMPSNGDILVPGNTISIIGTTSSRIGFDEVNSAEVTAEEVDLLLSEGKKLSPAVSKTRILRAYAGVRPLVTATEDLSGRSISRGIVLIDHEACDGMAGLITITGGKLVTYRLMAEKATDLACKKLGVNKPCITSEKLLPSPIQEKKDSHRGSLICECENVSVSEIIHATENLDTHNLADLRRRTRIGMGTCQGKLCVCRAVKLLEAAYGHSKEAKADLARFLDERWKGVYPVAWGEALRESEFTQWIYVGVCGMKEKEEYEV